MHERGAPCMVAVPKLKLCRPRDVGRTLHVWFCLWFAAETFTMQYSAFCSSNQSVGYHVAVHANTFRAWPTHARQICGHEQLVCQCSNTSVGMGQPGAHGTTRKRKAQIRQVGTVSNAEPVHITEAY